MLVKGFDAEKLCVLRLLSAAFCRDFAFLRIYLRDFRLYSQEKASVFLLFASSKHNSARFWQNFTHQKSAFGVLITKTLNAHAKTHSKLRQSPLQVATKSAPNSAKSDVDSPTIRQNSLRIHENSPKST